MNVYLTNRDCLTPVQGMVSHLQQCDEVDDIIIVDCGSTYPPLLDWYSSIEQRVIRCENLGPYAAWQVMSERSELYAVSDSDLDISTVPRDFLTRLRHGLIRYPQCVKAGLSLAIQDIPEHFPFRDEVISHESQFWNSMIDDEFYSAAIDTTFALYRTKSFPGVDNSIRLAPPYIARHLPWYLSSVAITEEWAYYFRHLEHFTHWSGKYRQLLDSR
jgi:hypothetical protein